MSDLGSETSACVSYLHDGNYPADVLYEIAEYLDPSDLANGLGEVNSYYQDVLHNESYWEVRTKKRFPSNSITGTLEGGTSWRKTALLLESRRKLYKEDRLKSNSHSCSITGAQSPVLVTALTLMDRGSLTVYAVSCNNRHKLAGVRFTDTFNSDNHGQEVEIPQPESFDTDNPLRQRCTTMEELSGHLILSGWYDTALTETDLQQGPVQTLRATEQVDSHSCLAESYNVVAQTRNGWLETFDVRHGPQSVTRLSAFRTTTQTTWKMEVNESYIYTAADEENRYMLRCVDRRANKICAEKMLAQLPGDGPIDHRCPKLHMHLSEGKLWLGCFESDAKVLDPVTLETLYDLHQYIPKSTNYKLCGLWYHAGQLMVVKDHGAAVLDMFGQKPKILWKKEAEIQATIAHYDFENNVLLTGGYPSLDGDPGLRMWAPFGKFL